MVLSPGTKVWSIYGMTEILPACAVSLDDKLTFDRDQGDLVGAPLRGIQATIDADGELLLSGDGLYDHYLGHEPIVQHRTGDIARLDARGRVILLGRKKDMIIRGNHNIYPALFEPTIREIPGVRDCALVGVYNAQKTDEEIILFITAMRHDETFRAAIQEALQTGIHSIDVYAQPDYILFAEIPYSGRSHKADKNALRQRARDTLGISTDNAAQVLRQPL